MAGEIIYKKNMSSTLLNGIADNELNEMLSPDLREKLAAIEQSWTAPMGTRLIQHGVMPEHLVIVHSGKVEVILHCVGKSVSCGFFDAGKVFGMRSIVSGELQELDVICAETCFITLLPREIFLGLLKANPKMYFAVARVLSSDLHIANDVLRNRVRGGSRGTRNQPSKTCVM